MGHEFRSLFQSETRKLLLLMGVMFAVVLTVQYELPYGSVLASVFSVGKASAPATASSLIGDSFDTSGTIGNMTHLNGSNSFDTSAVHELSNNTENSNVKEKNGHSANDFLLENLNGKNSTAENIDNADHGSLGAGGPEASFYLKNVTVSKNSSLSSVLKEDETSGKGGKDTGPASPLPALPPIISSANITFLTTLDTNIVAPVIPGDNSASPEKKNATDIPNGNTGPASPLPASTPIILSANITSMTALDTNVVPIDDSASPGNANATDTPNRDEKPGALQGEVAARDTSSSMTSAPSVKKQLKKPTAAVVTISEMSDLLHQSRASSHFLEPRWSSAVDQELLNAKLQIENAPIVRNDVGLYAPLYRNVSMFKRSYELMEQTLKVFIYKEGSKPVFHQPVLKGIYASEGWFMKLLEANRHFVTKKPRNAHLFYLPFSSRMLEETLYVANSHRHQNLIQYLKDYLDMIVAKYPFWNRTSGADHFLVACHDWAPAETRQIMAHCTRALCNSDVKEGFNFGRDVSLPETFVRSPQNLLKDLGGKPPSKRQILAFFAGSMHGNVRPILLNYWKNKDPDMKVFGRLPKVKGKMNYIQHMKSSKYCICAKGYEVNSPRVVEAIFYECVPVIISDNFVPPFFEILNWESFAVFVLEKDIPNLKNILLSIPQKRYLEMQRRVKKVQQHFLWHNRPLEYDLFHMILHSIWYNRVFQVRST